MCLQASWLTAVSFIFSTGNLLAGTPSEVSETGVVVFAGTLTATPTLVNVKFGAVPENAGHNVFPVSIVSADATDRNRHDGRVRVRHQKVQRLAQTRIERRRRVARDA